MACGRSIDSKYVPSDIGHGTVLYVTNVAVVRLIEFPHLKQVGKQTTGNVMSKCIIEGGSIAITKEAVCNKNKPVPATTDAFEHLAPPMGELAIDELLVRMQWHRAGIKNSIMGFVPT